MFKVYLVGLQLSFWNQAMSFHCDNKHLYQTMSDDNIAQRKLVHFFYTICCVLDLYKSCTKF